MNTSSPMNEQITTHFSGEHQPEVFKKLSENEALLQAVWNKYQAVMTEGEVDLQTKELIGFSVAVAKPNEYVIGLQQRRIRRVGIDDTGEQEAIAVAAFFEGLGAFSHALHIGSDDCPERTELSDISASLKASNAGIALVTDPSDPVVLKVYDEIRQALDTARVPSIFLAMAHQPEMLQAKWDCYKAIMLEGVLSRMSKELVAVAVCAVNGCSYCADVHATVARQLGLSEKGLVEAGCVIDLFSKLCTLAKGLRLGKRNF